MNRGYFLYSVPSGFSGAVTITDIRTGKAVNTLLTGQGFVFGDVKKSKTYKVTVINAEGNGIGWYFKGANFNGGYDFFTINAAGYSAADDTQCY